MTNISEWLGTAIGGLIVVGLLALPVAYLFNLLPWFTVGPGERGVLMTFGQVQPRSYGEGIHFKIPLIQSVEVLRVQTQKFEDNTEASSKDLQIVKTVVALNYHIDTEQAHEIYQKIGRNYEAVVIDPAIKESVKATTAQFTAEELITKREEVAIMIKESIRVKLEPRGIYVESMSIINFDFSKAFNDAIEAKVSAAQKKLQADRDLERIEVEARQTITRAEAEAKAIKIRAEALQQNEKLIPLTVAEKWDGHLPNVMVSGGNGNSAMLFDISNLAPASQVA